MKYYGLINKDGTEITGPICSRTGVTAGGKAYFIGDLLCVGSIDGPGQIYLNTEGETVLPKDGSIYCAANSFANGYAAVAEQASNLYGYINKDGNWLIPPRYVKASSFTQDGLACVALADDDSGDSLTVTYQIINTSGDCLFEAGVFGYTLNSERAAVMMPNRDGSPSKIGFWSANDGLVIDYIFDEVATTGFADDFSYAKVKYDGSWGMIDKDGNWLIPAKFMAIGY